MSELDKLIIKFLESLTKKEKLTELGRHEDAYEYLLTEVDLLCDIYYSITNEGGYSHNNAINHLNKYLESRFEININDYDRTQIIRAIKLGNLDL